MQLAHLGLCHSFSAWMVASTSTFGGIQPATRDFMMWVSEDGTLLPAVSPAAVQVLKRQWERHNHGSWVDWTDSNPTSVGLRAPVSRTSCSDQCHPDPLTYNFSIKITLYCWQGHCPPTFRVQDIEIIKHWIKKIQDFNFH